MLQLQCVLTVSWEQKHEASSALELELCPRLCLCVVRAVVQCEEKLTISASWSKDEDISRLLQSLPNWANMAQPRQTRQKREDEEDFTRYVRALEHTETPRAVVHRNVQPMFPQYSNKWGDKYISLCELCKHKQAADTDSPLSSQASNPPSRLWSFIRVLLNPHLLAKMHP